MTSSDNGDRGMPPSVPILGQEDRQEHEQKGQSPECRERTEIPAQSTLSHDANSPAAGSGKAGNQTKRGEREQHDRPLRDWGGIVAIANVILAFIGVGGLIFTGLQFNSMLDQLDQMKIANFKQNEAINVATRQAKAAETANKIASEALSSSDRAWIYPLIEVSGEPRENKIFQITTTTFNAGKTPAIHLRGKINLHVPPIGNPPVYLEPEENAIETVLFPGTQYPINSSFKAEQMNKIMIENLDKEISFIYVTNVLKYQDINGKDHTTISCSYYKFDEKFFTPCRTKGANYAD